MIDFLEAVSTRMPWWAACLLGAFISLAYFCLRALRLLIPDESGDRLAWWITVLEHRRRTAKTAVRHQRLAGNSRASREEDDNPL
ncbi:MULTISPECIES: hypothetical protein [Streptomyces]|uniref:hypothetical protein n=1 Tax=Streptomyces TaxID=1883 RepID=UPI0033C22885